MPEGWQAKQGDEYFSCSVCIMAHNEEVTIGRTIRAVLDQQAPSMRIAEVIVVASGCTDRTVPTVAEIALQEPRVRLCIQEKHDGKASAINLFLKEATSPVVVVIGADLLPEVLALQYLCAPCKNPTIGMARGRLVPVNDAAAVIGGNERCASIRSAPYDILDRRYLLSKTFPVTTVPEMLNGDDPGVLSTQSLHHLLCRTPTFPKRDSWAVCDTFSFAYDQFVCVAPQEQDFPIGPGTQRNLSLPPVGIVVPLRDSQRTIGQCVQSLLAQDYQGAFTILLVGNTPDQDASWEGLGDLVNHPGIQSVQLRRSATWVGRDANVKRYYGSFFALQTGAEVIALIDSQVEVPSNWLSTAIRTLDAQQVNGVAGISRRHPRDHTLPGVYQDGSLFSEWPRYGMMSLLSKANFGTAKKPPITANLLFSRNVFERIHDRWPLVCPYGGEDYYLAWEMVSGGATILCTDTLYVHRLHRSKFRLTKHFSAGIAALAFHQTHATNGYTSRLLLKAWGVVACLLALIVATLVLVSIQGIMALPELGVVLVLVLFPFSLLSVIKARDWRGIVFPLLDILHVGLLVAGAMYMLVQKGRISPELANTLVKYR